MSAVRLRPVDVNLSSFDRIVEEPPAIDRQFEPAQSWLNSQSVRLGLSRQCCRTIIWSGEFDYEQCAPITGSSPSAAPCGHGSRSEERRVGKKCVSTCRSRVSPDH